MRVSKVQLGWPARGAVDAILKPVRARTLELVSVVLVVSACSPRPAPTAPQPDADRVAAAARPARPSAGPEPAIEEPPREEPVAAAVPEPSTPPLPEGVAELPVPGHSPAAYVAPDPAIGPPPWPLVAVLHGNFDRPEWECATWAAEGRRRGWVLCPRGIPRTDAPPGADRWTFANRVALAEELEADAAELGRVHPGLVRMDGAVVIGFSLGAHMAPRLVGGGHLRTIRVRALVLGEGGYGVTAEVARSVVRRGVSAVAYLCGGRTACASMARQSSRTWRAARLPEPGVIIMPDVGHGYADDFDPFAARVFEALGL